MLLKDCPVGSFVRLVSFNDDRNWGLEASWWNGKFEVLEDSKGKYVVTNDKQTYRVENNSDFQFEIVKPAPKSKGRSKFNVGDRVVCTKHEEGAEIGREYTVTSDDAGYISPAFRFLDDDGEDSAYMNDDSFVLSEIFTPNTITLNGKTYKLKPHTEPRLTVIDGVTYEMEEI